MSIHDSLNELKKRIVEIEDSITEFEDEGASDKKKARQIAGKLLQIGEAAESVATEIADAAVISLDTGDYGYGRTYYPKGHDYWSESQAEDYGSGSEHGYWLSSSDMC